MTKSVYQVLKTKKILSDLDQSKHLREDIASKFSLDTLSNSQLSHSELDAYTHTKQMHTAKLHDIMQSMQMKSLNRVSAVLSS